MSGSARQSLQRSFRCIFVLDCRFSVPSVRLCRETRTQGAGSSILSKVKSVPRSKLAVWFYIWQRGMPVAGTVLSGHHQGSKATYDRRQLMITLEAFEHAPVFTTLRKTAAVFPPPLLLPNGARQHGDAYRCINARAARCTQVLTRLEHAVSSNSVDRLFSTF